MEIQLGENLGGDPFSFEFSRKYLCYSQSFLHTNESIATCSRARITPRYTLPLIIRPKMLPLIYLRSHCDVGRPDGTSTYKAESVFGKISGTRS